MTIAITRWYTVMESIVNQKYSFCSAFSSEVLEETLRYELSLSFIYRNRSQSIRLDSITIVSIFLEWKLSFLFLPLITFVTCRVRLKMEIKLHVRTELPFNFYSALFVLLMFSSCTMNNGFWSLTLRKKGSKNGIKISRFSFHFLLILRSAFTEHYKVIFRIIY